MRPSRQEEGLALVFSRTDCSSIASREKADAHSCVEAYGSPLLFASLLSETGDKLIYKGEGERVWEV